MSARTRLLLDLGVLAAIAVAANPLVTGLSLHEWVSAMLVVPALVHLIVNWDWVVRTIRGLLGEGRVMARINLALDVGFFGSLVGVTVSGLLVVPGLAASLGLLASPYWHAVHLLTSQLTIAFTVAHLLMHAPWIAETIRRMLPAPRPIPHRAAVVHYTPARAASAPPHPQSPASSR
jgi:hypothetical protein